MRRRDLTRQRKGRALTPSPPAPRQAGPGPNDAAAIGRLVRTDVATLSVASQAAIGGPTTAMALAIARKWPALLLPGLAAGLIGYAVGNYAGFGIAYLVRSLVG